MSAEQWRTANQAALAVAKLIDRGAKVLVTCQAGLNRSGLVSALALRLLTGLSGEDAARIVRGARRRALSNPYFVKLLSALPGRGEAARIEGRLRRLG